MLKTLLKLLTPRSLAFVSQPDSHGVYTEAPPWFFLNNKKNQGTASSNPEPALYNNFISSDYLLQHVNFSPDQTLKRIGDGFYEQKLIREQLLAQTGRRFLQKDITDDNAQYQSLMLNAVNQQTDLELIPGVSLTAQQIVNLTQDIVWLEAQSITLADGTSTRALVPVVYIADASQYKVEGSKIIAGNDINLNLDNLNNAGLLQAGDSISISALKQITNQGGNIQADKQITLLANNNINNISANIKAKDISLTSISGDINNVRFEQEADYSRANTKDTKKLIGKQSNIIATNNLNLNTNNTINLQGSSLAANNIDLNANKVNINTTQQKTNFFSGDSKSYFKQNSTTHLNSTIKANNNLNINANEQVSIKGAEVAADNQININSKTLDIASVKDTTYSQFHSESKGGFFGGGHSTTTTTSTTTNKQSKLSAKDINISNNLTQIKASKLEAQTIQITTELLKLVSDKDLDFKQVQSDSSGLLTRTITDKGHNKQSVVDARINTNQFILNNQDISNQLSGQSLEDILQKTLSSQNAISKALQDKGINLQTLKANSQHWDESSTTLSGLGKIIVQVAANAIAPGAGQGFINAAMASVQSQMVSALATSAITGNSLSIDPKQILKTALTAGASQYATSNFGAASYNANTDFSTNLQNGLQNTAITTGVSTAINGGSLTDNLKDNLKNSVLTTATAKGANTLGANKASLGEVGHKVAHAALGCAGATLGNGDCASGALGAVAAEIAGEMYAKNKDIASMSDKQREQLLAQTKLVAQLVAVASAELAGKDINSAFDAGTNAVENNLNSELRRKFIEADMYQLVADGRLPQSTYDEVLKEIDAADKAGAEALVAYLSLMPVGQGINVVLQGGKEIIKRFGASGLKKVVGKLKNKQIRKQYKKEVTNLAKESKELLKIGKSKEEVARYLSKKRRTLGEKYKNITSPKSLEEIYKRNLEKYGDKLGPSIETLRKRGQSWDDIIKSSSRPGGKDLGL